VTASRSHLTVQVDVTCLLDDSIKVSRIVDRSHTSADTMIASVARSPSGLVGKKRVRGVYTNCGINIKGSPVRDNRFPEVCYTTGLSQRMREKRSAMCTFPSVDR